VTDLALEPVPDLASIRTEWTALADRCGNLFGTWEWADAWWRAYGAERPLMITACRDADGRLRAVLPLFAATGRPVRALRMLGTGPADQLGPICAPEDRPAAAAALLRLLDRRSSDWDVLLAERLAPGEGWPALLGGRVVHTEPSPSLAIDGAGFEDYLAARSRNFREQVRRRERKLFREHDARYRLADAASLDADLDSLFRLHDERWGDDGSGALAGDRQDFHRDFAGRALERGWLRLWTLEVGERAVACWYGFRFGGVDWYYQSGRDPDWERASVGFVLLAHTVRMAFEDGMREYRFLRGGEDYKGRFAPADQGLETLALARGLAGRCALVAPRVARSLPEPIRRRFVELAG
jgi:CelD/BcsL family acetyltransferase involved in cellulose biosynthesis